jgi:4-carboxymuconolactone decarboxylase
MIAALGKMEEFQTHTRGALNNGMTENEIRAVLTQIAIYCGIPVGVDCFRHAKPVIDSYKKK